MTILPQSAPKFSQKLGLRTLLCLAILQVPAIASEQHRALDVAVASNFAFVLKVLIPRFESQFDTKVRMSTASTGKLFAQIVQGRKLDVFLAADQHHVDELLQRGLGLKGSQEIYALGKLALWQPNKPIDPVRVGRNGVISSVSMTTLALATPTVAPYGKAAEQTIQNCFRFSEPMPKLVYGESVGQTFSYVATGNASAGLVALSSLRSHPSYSSEFVYEIDPSCHDSIIQSAIVLKSSQKQNLASSFIEFLISPPSQSFIESMGYQPI